ncbi:putative reverse transcriptase domain-containing protein [Tanacetum coccineum]
MARKLMSQTEQQEYKVAENASNKRKWEGNHNGSSSQQNKGHKLPRAHTTWPINKKAYVGTLPLLKFQKRVDKKISTLAERQAENKKKLNNTSNNNQNQQQPNKRSSSNANAVNNQRVTRASQKATCYECGNQGHYRSDCPERKNQNHENQTGGTGARGVVHALRGGETDQDPNNIKDKIEA